ncbi:MAG: hypothetical protein K2G89_02940 [Lachnospiraceae bacterium]|nr:hypothetical protein [Lachnospiraceae bacterium]
MEDIQNYLKVLSDSLEQKKTVLTQILEVTRRQERIAMAQAEEFSEIEFSNTVNEKEVLIARLNQLDDGFLSVYNRIRQDVIDQGGLYDPEIRRMQEQIKVCVDIGNEIQVLEERNQTKMALHFSAKQEEYKARANMNSVAKSYHQSMSGVNFSDPFFMDQKK